MATPILDAEIVKLRRRIGDQYNEDGTEITTANVGASSDTGVTWKRDELLDIYNDACRLFLDYVMAQFPKELWHIHIEGYIIYKTNNVVTSGKIDLSSLNPTLYRIMDVRTNGATTEAGLGTFIPPNEFFATSVGMVKTRKPDANHIFYTVMSEGTLGSLVRSLYFLPTSPGNQDLIYVRNHQDAGPHGGSNDLSGLSNEALRRVQLMAEIEARSYKVQSDAAIAKLSAAASADRALIFNEKEK